MVVDLLDSSLMESTKRIINIYIPYKKVSKLIECYKKVQKLFYYTLEFNARMTLHFPLNPWAKNVLEFICHAPSILSPHIYILCCNIQVICLSRYYVYIVSATATITLFCRLRVTLIFFMKQVQMKVTVAYTSNF